MKILRSVLAVALLSVIDARGQNALPKPIAQPPAGVTAKAGSDEAAAGLESLRLKYEKPLEEVATQRASRFLNLREGYLKALENLRKTQVSQGNLDAVVMTKAEQERMGHWADPSPEERKQMPPALAQLRQQYDSSYAGIVATQKQKEDSIKQAYARDLDALQRELTKQDHIEAALQVKAVRDKLTADLATPAAPTAPSGPVAVDQPSSAPLAVPSGKPVEWVSLPFPRDSDWSGSRGKKARVDAGEIEIRGQPVGTRQSFTGTVTLECDVVLDGYDANDGFFCVLFMPEETPNDKQGRECVAVMLGYHGNGGSGGFLTVDQPGRSKNLKKNSFSLKAGEPYHLKIAALPDSLQVSLNGQTYEASDFAVPFKKFRIRMGGWQPDNIWMVRKLSVH